MRIGAGKSAVSVLGAIAIGLAMAGCGGAAPPLEAPSATQTVVVQVSPSSAVVGPSGTASFASAVTGSVDTGVTWQVAEASGGTVDASGRYTAPTVAGAFHVIATSQADPTKSATAIVTVTPGATCQPVTCRANIDCGTISDGCGGTIACGTTCTSGQTCGGGGTPNVCGGATCQPVTCRASVDCGTISDGCGGTIACGTTCSSGQTCGGGGTPNVCGGGSGSNLALGGFFPIAAYGENPRFFQAWKDIGVNTVQGVPSLDVAGWASSARSLGLKQIRQPIGSVGASPPTAGNYSSMRSDPDYGTGNVIAWEGVMPNSTGWDEIEWSIGASANTMNYSINTGDALHALDPSTPTFLNTGINGLGPTYSYWPYTGGTYNYQGLFQSIDWVCNDLYPYGGSSYNDEAIRGSQGGDHVVTAADVTRWPELAPMLGKGAITSIGQVTEKLRAVLPNKTFFSFIEIACVTSNSPTVPPGGVRAEMWNAIIHGARGIFVFTYAGQIASSTGDGGGCAAMPAANGAELKAQSATITSLSSVLQDAINPSTLAVTMSSRALEAGWRDTPSGKYFFVLNTTNAALPAPATITLTGIGGATTATVYGESRSVSLSGGSFTDTFGPYALHIYVVQ